MMTAQTLFKTLFLLMISTTFAFGCGSDSDHTSTPNDGDDNNNNNNNNNNDIKVTEGNPCTAPDACETGLACIANQGTTTEGTCKTFVPCTAMEDCASQGTNNACIYVQGIGEKVQLCGEQDDNTGGTVETSAACTMVNDCVKGNICVADLGKTKTGTCKPVDSCESDSDCDPSSEKPTCIEIQAAGSTTKVCGKPYCDKDNKCTGNQVCIIAGTDYTKGHCVESCSDDSECSGRADGKTECGNKSYINVHAGNSPSVTGRGICSIPETQVTPLGQGGGNCKAKPCADGYVCVKISDASSTCTLPCETEGFGKGCNSTYVDYCYNTTDLKDDTSTMVCGPAAYVIKRDDKKTEIPSDQVETTDCDEDHLCPYEPFFNTFLCVKENAADTTGKCLELAGGDRQCGSGYTVVTVQKDRILTQGEIIADDELQFCQPAAP